MTFSADAEDSVLRDYPSNKKCPNNYLRNRTTKLCTRKKTKKSGSETKTKRIIVKPVAIDAPVVIDDSNKKYTVRNLTNARPSEGWSLTSPDRQGGRSLKPAVKENSDELDYPENKRCPSGYTRNKLTRKCSRKKQKQPKVTPPNVGDLPKVALPKVASPLRSEDLPKVTLPKVALPKVTPPNASPLRSDDLPETKTLVFPTWSPFVGSESVVPHRATSLSLQPIVQPTVIKSISPVSKTNTPLMAERVSPVMQLQPEVSPVMQAAVSPVVQAAVSPVMQAAVSPVVQAAVSPVMQAAVSPVVQAADVSHVSPVIQPVVRPEERHWSSKYGYCYRVNDLGEIRWETLEEKVKAEREIEVNMVYDQTTNKVDAPECPRYITGLNLIDIAQKMRTESVKILERSGYKIVFSLADDYTANLTRSLQEDQILKVNLKLKQKDRVITLPSFWEVWFRSDNKLKNAIVNLANKLAKEGNDPNEAKWMLQKDFGYKIPTTFMPSYAKSIYEYFGAKRILDPCAGWGDRFAGALASNRVKQYIAFDPNTRLRYGHTKTAEAFGVLPIVYNEEKVAFNNGHEIHYLPFEIGAQKLTSNSFDLVFTSPPFFDYEMYNEDNPNYVDWIKEFYMPLVIHSARCVKPGGHVCLYLGDTSAGRIQSFLENEVSRITPLVFMYEIGFMGLNSSKVRGINVYKKMA